MTLATFFTNIKIFVQESATTVEPGYLRLAYVGHLAIWDTKARSLGPCMAMWTNLAMWDTWLSGTILSEPWCPSYPGSIVFVFLSNCPPP